MRVCASWQERSRRVTCIFGSVHGGGRSVRVRFPHRRAGNSRLHHLCLQGRRGGVGIFYSHGLSGSVGSGCLHRFHKSGAFLIGVAMLGRNLSVGSVFGVGV